MKKVLFGLLGLGAIVSLVVVMSCGGSSSSGTAPTDAGSVATATSVSAIMSNVGLPGLSSIDDIRVSEATEIPATEVDCPNGGIVTVSGNITVDAASEENYAVTADGTEVMADCTVTDAEAPLGCGFGDVVGNGTMNWTLDISGTQSTYSISETIKGTGLTFGYHSKTLTCDIDIALNIDSSLDLTEDNIASAITGTICGADWAQVQAALDSATEMETLCAALDASAANL